MPNRLAASFGVIALSVMAGRKPDMTGGGRGDAYQSPINQAGHSGGWWSDGQGLEALPVTSGGLAA